MANLAGKTFEVQTHDGDRWTVADVHEARSPAIEQAEQLLETNQYFAVQVIADSDRAGTEVVFEKEAEEKPVSKKIQVSPIEEAAFCKDLEDYYGFESRRTIGRLMRQYLDEFGMSALELMFNASNLKMLELNETLFPAAVQRVAGMQAKAAKSNPAERADELYDAVTAVRERAVETDAADEVAETIKTKGLDAALDMVDMSVGKKDRAVAFRFGLARYMKGAGDWNGKFQLLAELGVEGLSERGRGYLDEALAELADAASAMMELLGGQPDRGTANRTIILLAAGRCPAPKNPISCIEAVNDVMAHLELPLTRRMLYERVADEIGSTRPLTREGKDKDRDIFVTIVCDLIELAGLEGGSAIAEAMIRRARIVLGADEDLSFEAAVSCLLDLLPHRAVRMGFLLDLVVSPLGQQNQGAVFSILGRLVQQMSSISSFLPKGSSPELLDATVDSLKRRLTAEGLPKAWRQGITEALDHVSQRSAPMRGVADVAPYELDAETKRIIAMTPDHESFDSGKVLFEEGESGDAAYLIKSGEVEIVRKIGNEEMVVARLGRGEIFGEMSLIDNQPRMATARVSEDAELAVVTRENIQSRLSRLESSDAVLRRLIDVFVTRIRGEARLHE